MAGIGFEIRKILKEKTIFSIVRAFSYAGVISSGPWIISMVSILIAYYIAGVYFKDKIIAKIEEVSFIPPSSPNSPNTKYSLKSISLL